MQKIARTLSSLGILGLLSVACQTAPPTPEESNVPPLPAPPVRYPGKPSIDLGLLQRQLRMDRNIRELGFEEKAFDPCREGIAQAPDCSRRFMSVINFRLQCRESEGTDQHLTSDDIHAIETQDAQWTLGKLEGRTTTDFEGYGQVVALSPKSTKRDRFRLTVKGRFLVITAEHVSRVVAPGNWCRERN